MRQFIRQNLGSSPEGELSWFLIAYLLMLLGGLLLVHVLQPARDPSGTSSRSPVHQQKAR